MRNNILEAFRTLKNNSLQPDTSQSSMAKAPKHASSKARNIQLKSHQRSQQQLQVRSGKPPTFKYNSLKMAKSIQGYINPSHAEYEGRIADRLRDKPVGGQWDRQKREISQEASHDEVEYVAPTPPSALSPRHIYSRMVSRQLSKRSSERSLQARILNNMSPREMQSNQLLREKPPIIRE